MVLGAQNKLKQMYGMRQPKKMDTIQWLFWEQISPADPGQDMK